MSKTGRCGLALASVLCAAALGGCSSNSDAGPPVALAGHWQFWMDITGEEIGPFPLYLEQSGSALDGASITGTVNGNSFTMTLIDPNTFDMIVSGTAVGNTASGTLSVPALSLTGTFRMQTLATPTGTLNVGGDIGGQTVSIAATEAVGAREYSDVALTQLSEIEVSFGDADVYFELEFDATDVTLGTLNVGSGAYIEVEYRTDTDSYDLIGTAGTVTVTQYDATGFVATFSMTLDSGDTITGGFSVTWDIEAYEP